MHQHLVPSSSLKAILRRGEETAAKSIPDQLPLINQEFRSNAKPTPETFSFWSKKGIDPRGAKVTRRLKKKKRSLSTVELKVVLVTLLKQADFANSFSERLTQAHTDSQNMIKTKLLKDMGSEVDVCVFGKGVQYVIKWALLKHLRQQYAQGLLANEKTFQTVLEMAWSVSTGCQ